MSIVQKNILFEIKCDSCSSKTSTTFMIGGKAVYLCMKYKQDLYKLISLEFMSDD